MVKLILNLEIEDKKWNKYVVKKNIKSLISQIIDNVVNELNIEIKNKTTIELSMFLTNDKNIKIINKKYRNIDKATNVLSFPMYEKEFFEVVKCEKHIFLGDMILSIDTFIKESEEQNIQFDFHLKHLILHSILHLIGFDHQNICDAKKMESLEQKLLNKI